MTPEKHKLIKELFLEVCVLDESERVAVLNQKCGGDAELRAAVERLLTHDHDPRQLEESAPIHAQLEGLFEEFTTTKRKTGPIPERIGTYQILELVGEGGFGSVYKAQQTEPVRRTVAIKVIKPGMVTEQVVSRFMAERQALALMDHPGIAQIYDGGETESGQPFFVMEWIEGSPITQYCDENTLSLRKRLHLFIRVCRAVQYAHQKGIIHRDIKPSNILVNHTGGTTSSEANGAIPKVIDFGIAKALGDSLGKHTLFTEHGQMIGTPEYMSPEQASGNRDIDTRSDIYSLGVLLYELMTGTTPLDRSTVTERGLAEFAHLQRAVCEEDAPTPSNRLKTIGEKSQEIAKQRRTDSHTLRRLLRGDLDWIVMKAIEKNRDRRYESAGSFAADVQRHLHDEPVAARPPTLGYRFTKFARRNRGTLVAANAIAIALLAGSILALVGWRKSIASEARARSKASIAQAVNDFLNNDLLGAVSPDALGNDVRMRKVVEVASDRLKGKFAGQPEVEAAIHLTLGTTFRKLWDGSRAQYHLDKCRTMRTELFGVGHLETLEVLHEIGLTYALLDQNAEAESLLRTTWEGRKQLLGPFHRDTLSTLYELSVAIGEQGRFAETEQLMGEALSLCRAHLGDADPLTIRVIRGVGVLYWTRGQFERAGVMYEEARTLAAIAGGLEFPLTLLVTNDLANYYIHEKRWEEAEALLADALPVSQRVRGENHPATLMIMVNLASAYHGLNRDAEAESLYFKTSELASATLPPGHSITNVINRSLANMYFDRREFTKAEPLLLACVVGLEGSVGPMHPFTLRAIKALVSNYEAMGDHAKAATWNARISKGEHDEHSHE